MKNTRFQWVNTNFLLSKIDPNLKHARKKYLRFIRCETEYPKEILFEFNTPVCTHPKSRHTFAIDINKLIQHVATAYCYTPQQLTEHNSCHRRSEARAAIGYLATKFHICSLTTVAAAFHRSQSTISQAVYRFERRLDKDPSLWSAILNIEKSIF